MIIYQAMIYDHGEHYAPENEIGIYSELQLAQSKAEKASRYLDEEPRVNVMQLAGREFANVGTWSLDKTKPNPVWLWQWEVGD